MKSQNIFCFCLWESFAGSFLGALKWSQLDQYGAKRIPKGNPKRPKWIPKHDKIEAKAPNVRPKAIKPKKTKPCSEKVGSRMPPGNRSTRPDRHVSGSIVTND